MACHEIAALRLGLMTILGIDDEAERQHELAELGPVISEAGPIKTLAESTTLSHLRKAYEISLLALEQKVATTAAGDPKLPYYRSLIIATKQTELSLQQQIENLERLYRDLDEMHDFIHEVYPAE
jgi:hypothetical protein